MAKILNIAFVALIAAGSGLGTPVLQAMSNHHEYYPHGWQTPILYGAEKVSGEMIDFDPQVPGPETLRELFILPDDAGRVYRLSHNGRVFCYVFDHDLLDPWDFEVVDHDGSGGFEIKQPPFTDFPLPRWTFVGYSYLHISRRQTTADLTAAEPTVQELIAALTGQGAAAGPDCSPEKIKALTIARGGSPPPPELCRPGQAEVPGVALNILFEFNQASLTPQAVGTLNTLGRALTSKELAGGRFRLEGHTDAVGDYDYNMNLSLKRAQAVRRYLLANFNLSGEQLIAAGLGESRPLPSTAPEDGRNRRVEVSNVSGIGFPGVGAQVQPPANGIKPPRVAF